MLESNIEIILEFLNHIRDIRKYSAHTIRSYKTDLNQYSIFLDRMDNINIIKVDREIIRSYLIFLDGKDIKSKTIARKIAVLKSFYKFLTHQKIIPINPIGDLHTPKIPKSLPHLLSQKQISKLMSLPDLTDNKGIRDYAILELFYSTGIRISELIIIQYSDIKLESGTILIHGKGGKDRIVILGDHAINALKNYIYMIKKDKNNFSENYLFPSYIKRKKNKKNVHPIGIKTVYNIVRKYLKIISSDEKLSPHSLRHSFATHLLENGADLMAVKDMLGHNSLTSTQIYTHIQKEKLKNIYNQAHPDGK